MNSQYLVLFKNPSDAAQIAVIGRQMYPHNPNFPPEAYCKATKRPHGNIVIDLRQETPVKFRIRSRVLKEEFPMRIYKQVKRQGKHYKQAWIT